MADTSGQHKNNIKTVSVLQLYKFASWKDKFLMTIGFLCAIVYGTRLMALIFSVINLFIHLSTFNSELSLDQQITKSYNSSFHGSSQIITFESAKTIIENSFYEFAILIAIITFTSWACNFIMMTTLNYAAQNQTLKCQEAYVKSLMRQDISWFDCNQTGKLVSQTTDDFQKFQDAIGFKMGYCLSCLFGYIIPVVYCLFLNWKLTLIPICFSSLYIVSYKMLSISKMVFSKKESIEYAKAGSIAEEVLTAIKTVVSFGSERIEVQRYKDFLKNGTKAGCYKAIMAAVAMILFYFAYCASYCVTAYYGYHMYSRRRNTNNDDTNELSIMVVITVLNTCGFRLSEAFGHIDAISYARTSAARIFAIMHQVPTINPADHEGITLPKINTIKFQNVSFSYPNRSDIMILNDFNLELKSGETVAIVGESGSGKSTVTSLLQRFYDVSSGNILINDVNIRSLSPTWIRSKIGHVIQEPVLFPMTISENIACGKMDASRVDIENAGKLANAHDFIQGLPLKYETLVGDRGTQLSGGQKQRVAIARALIRNPEILLLDEATSALDTHNETLVQSALEKAVEGKATIIVAHRLSTIRNASRIVVMSFGRIIEVGTHEQLMSKKGMYYDFAIKQIPQSKLPEKSSKIQTIDATTEIIPGQVVNGMKLESQNIHINKEISINIFDGKKSSICPVFFRLFQLGVLESFLLFFGIIGSFLFGLTNTCFGLQSIPQMAAIFSPNKYQYEQEDALKEYIIFLSVCGILFITSVIFQIGFLGILGPLIQKKLRHQMFSSLMSQDMTFFDNPANSVGSLCLLLSLDAENVKNALCSYIGIMLNVFAQLVTSITCAFIMSWELGIVQLGTFICALSACIILHTMVHKKEKETTSRLQESNEVLRQSVMNIRTVISLGLENTFQNKLLNCYSKTSESKWSMHIITMLNVFVETSSYAGLIVDGLLAVPTLLQGKLVFIFIFRILILLLRNNNTVRSIAAIPKYIAANNSMKRIFTIIDHEFVEKNKHVNFLNLQLMPSKTAKTEKNYIEFKNIQFSYPKRRNEIILNDFNLNVKRGQMIALVGESGSGKSTCIQLLEQFYKPNVGSVMLSGRNISDIGLSARQHMALVNQEPSLFNRTIFENIAYGNNNANISMGEVVEAAKIANAHDFITKFPSGYDTCVGDRGVQISGGQKQRIAIARALLRKSEILLLDEATSALDTETEKSVQQSLQESERDRTLIIVAHRLSTIRDADVIYVVNKGKIVEAGSHSELIALQGKYYTLHNSITYNV